jgi:hypothetical protein
MPGWRVISQRQQDELTPNNTFDSVLVVTYELDTGTRRTVKIPARLATTDYVRDAIAKDAEHAAGIDGLSSP